MSLRSDILWTPYYSEHKEKLNRAQQRETQLFFSYLPYKYRFIGVNSNNNLWYSLQHKYSVFRLFYQIKSTTKHVLSGSTTKQGPRRIPAASGSPYRCSLIRAVQTQSSISPSNSQGVLHTRKATIWNRYPPHRAQYGWISFDITLNAAYYLGTCTHHRCVFPS